MNDVEKHSEDLMLLETGPFRLITGDSLCFILQLDGEKIITPARGAEGVDIYISTSSAGGGLQMMVAGVVVLTTFLAWFFGGREPISAGIGFVV